MADLLKTFDYGGVKMALIDQLPEDAWEYLTGGQTEGDRQKLYQKVPFIFRGVQLRANNVSTLPFAIVGENDEDVDTSGDYQNVVGFLPDPVSLLYLTEAALTILGYSYAHKSYNMARMLDVRYLLPTSIKPKFKQDDATKELEITFERKVRGETYTLTTDDVLYFWARDPFVEIGPPESSPAQAALSAGGVTLSKDEFAELFFKRGAIKATVLTVEGNPKRDELDKLKTWWGRFITGIKNAWNASIIHAKVQPVVIGEGLSELSDANLSKEKREDIATALGVPITLLWSSEVGGLGGEGVVRQDDLRFYNQTILPEAQFIEKVLNTQLFEGTPWRWQFRPETLDVFQADEKERSGSYLTYVSAKMRPSIAAQILGIELPPGVEYEALDEDYDAERAEPETGESGQEQPAQDVNITLAKAVNTDLKRWRKKARKNADAAFVSSFIPPHMQNAIKWAIGKVGPERAFDFLKQADVGPAEAAMQDAVGKVLAKWLPKITGQVARNETPDLQGLKDDLNRVLEPQLVTIATEQALRAAQGVGVEFDVAVVNDEAAAWARGYSFELVTGLVETTRKRLSKAIETYTTTPGMTRGELEALLEPAFGPKRAEMIAVTEVTRAYSRAASQYQNMIRAEAGVEMARIWQTNADELVCPICGPLNGQPESEWGLDFPDGPPAHVNCRCFVTLEVV